MKLIFIAATGVQQALIAANIFLERPNTRDFRLIKGFCDSFADRSGYPIYVGENAKGIKVYTLGVGKELLLAKRMIEDLRVLLGKKERDLMIQPVTIPGEKFLLLLTKIPAFFGGEYINRWISSYLLHKHYQKIYEPVTNFKALLNRRMQKHQI